MAHRPDNRPEPAGEIPTLDSASRLADQGRHEEAAAACEAVIRREGPTAAVYFLLGIVRQAQGDRGTAERCLEKAVYLDPNHHEALLALSAAATRRGAAAAAANFLRRAGRADGKDGTR